MRTLLADSPGPDARAYRRFVQRAEIRGMFADLLVEGEPFLALDAIVLEADAFRQIRELTNTFASAFQRAGMALAADVAQLVEIGFPWAAAELLADEPRRAPIVGRFDFVPDAAGRWWLLEFNADTPSGIREAIEIDALAYDFLGAQLLDRPNAGLTEALREAFRSSLAGLDRGDAVGFVTTAGELEDLAQTVYTAELLRPTLADLGLTVVVGDADNLAPTRRGLTVCGQLVRALYRYVPFESLFGTPAFAALFEAVTAGQLDLLNGLYGLLLQNKAIMAWLWEHRADPLLDERERHAIIEHLPPTWMIDRLPTGVSPNSLVAKQVFGREGEEVFFGMDLPPDVWQTLVRRRTYVAQQRVEIAGCSALVATSRGLERQVGYPAVGSFAVDGRWAGFYTRFGGRIITSRARWLATFAERDGE